jgi:hypothetical protein
MIFGVWVNGGCIYVDDSDGNGGGYVVALLTLTSVEDAADVTEFFTSSVFGVGVDVGATGHPHPMQAVALSLISLLHSGQLINATCQPSTIRMIFIGNTIRALCSDPTSFLVGNEKCHVQSLP